MRVAYLSVRKVDCNEDLQHSQILVSLANNYNIISNEYFLNGQLYSFGPILCVIAILRTILFWFGESYFDNN